MTDIAENSDCPLGTHSLTLYVVETTWPGSTEPRWARYSASAYTLADDPGADYAHLAFARRQDLYEAREYGDRMAFRDRKIAVEVALLLNEQGRIATGWAGTEEWRKKYQKPIRARVVTEIVLTHREVVFE